MPFCSQCGTQITESMKFCPGCGTRLSAIEDVRKEVLLPDAQTNSADPGTTGGDYRVILFSLGSCATATARELLEDIMGYTTEQARQLATTTPVEIACGLSYSQAVTLAQALTEYGMEISVCNSSGYIDIPVTATESVYDSGGNFLPAAAAILGLFSAVNRVKRIQRWNHSGPRPGIFRLGFRRPAPPRHRRHSLLFRTPAPRYPAVPPRPIRRPISRYDPFSFRGPAGRGSRPFNGFGGPGPSRGRRGPSFGGFSGHGPGRGRR